MAVIVPGAEWRPNPVSSVRIALRWVILHTIVGTVAGSLSGRHYHIYVRADGTFVQIQDLLLRSAASVQANPYSIAITAEDKGPAFPAWSGNNVPPYTNAQVDTIVKILVWICRRFGLPPEAVRDTCLGGAKGTCWHRLGIDGNWPLWPSIFRGRENKACLGTSLSFGKGCPGNERIKQINYVIIPRVIAILRGVPPPPPPPPPEDDMTPAECEAVLNKVITTAGHPFRRELAAIVDSRLDRKAGKDWLVAVDVDGQWWRTNGRTRTLVSGRPYAEWLIGSGFVFADGLLPHVVSQETIDRLDEEPAPAPPS